MIPPEILRHYDGYDEATRLRSGDGLLEETRTRQLFARYLPPPPAAIADVGGATGVYAHWLASLGYEVHLRDIVADYVARAEAGAVSGHPLASAAVRDARRLDFEDESMDAVLVMGPLYHLTDRDDRLAALAEACRVVRPDGIVFTAAISRYASALDGLWRNLLADPDFLSIMERDLAEGQHRNPTGNPVYFTTAFFHTPAELHDELVAAGLTDVQVKPVEGIGWIVPDFDERWGDAEARAALLEVVAATEDIPELLGVSQHLLGIGRKGSS